MTASEPKPSRCIEVYTQYGKRMMLLRSRIGLVRDAEGERGQTGYTEIQYAMPNGQKSVYVRESYEAVRAMMLE